MARSFSDGLSSTWSRRKFLGGTASVAASLSLGSAECFALGDTPTGIKRPGPAEALKVMMAGNARFAAGTSTHAGRTPADYSRLAGGQAPMAAIIGCADSRVSPEIVFDAGNGDLFVIRVAGNFVRGAGASVTGSIEYAVAELGVPLLMVLGHSGCGAVKAAIQHLHDKTALPGSIEELVNNIRPSVTESEGKPGDLLTNSIRANVRRSVEKMKALDPIVAPKVKAGTVHVVGGVYDLATGTVTLL